MPEATVTGLVTSLRSGFYVVETGQGAVMCKLRGRLKQGLVKRDIIALGDQVQIIVFPDGTGAIEALVPR
jgi:ribosome biogenesis GTPase / thiamine phosphate phosphatase